MFADEQWRSIPGYETFYEVSNLGRIRSIARRVVSGRGFRNIKGKVLNPSSDKDGYLLVSLSRGDGIQKSHRVHQLVMEAFVGPRPAGHETRHLNGTPHDCRLANLQYGTGEENWADRRAHGRGIDGERNPHAIRRKHFDLHIN